MAKMSITFEVHDDLPSERRLQYRQAIIDAMVDYKADVEQSIADFGRDRVRDDELQNAELIDKMLEDCNR